MKDAKQIVGDTLRTMMGATAADPYVRAIERAIDAATPQLPGERALALLETLVNEGSWYPGAIELGLAKIDGEEALRQALSILEDAGRQ